MAIYQPLAVNPFDKAFTRTLVGPVQSGKSPGLVGQFEFELFHQGS